MKLINYVLVGMVVVLSILPVILGVLVAFPTLIMYRGFTTGFEATDEFCKECFREISKK